MFNNLGLMLHTGQCWCRQKSRLPPAVIAKKCIVSGAKNLH